MVLPTTTPPTILPTTPRGHRTQHGGRAPTAPESYTTNSRTHHLQTTHHTAEDGHIDSVHHRYHPYSVVYWEYGVWLHAVIPQDGCMLCAPHSILPPYVSTEDSILRVLGKNTVPHYVAITPHYIPLYTTSEDGRIHRVHHGLHPLSVYVLM